MATAAEIADLALQHYPEAFLKGIPELTFKVFATLFPEWKFTVSGPQAIYDCRMTGEAVSLIALESTWCRGFMMMQADCVPLLSMLGESPSADPDMDARAANSLLGEVTNLVWGAFKKRYIGPDSEYRGSPIQVPLMIDRVNGNIYFGTENPQLRFLYTLSDDTGHSLQLDQRFIFNLHWAPEDFRELSDDRTAIETGALEIFSI